MATSASSSATSAAVAAAVKQAEVATAAANRGMVKKSTEDVVQPQQQQQQQQRQGQGPDAATTLAEAKQAQPTAAQLRQAASTKLLFELSLIFYKQHREQLNYDAKVKLAALFKQATHGPFDPTKSEAPGFFDFVGHERRAAWQALGQLSQEEAEQAFTAMLEETRSDFADWLDKRLMQKFNQEQEERQRRHRELAEAERRRQEALRQEALRQQQMEAERRSQQRAEAQAAKRAQQQESILAVSKTPRATLTSPAYIEEFKKSLQDKPDCEADVSSGEVLTVRVPKPDHGRMQVTWQFHTLDYDIQFGVDFEHKAEDGTLETETVAAVSRLNSHLEVVTGSHVADREGTWLLKFDNSYSYFRGKKVLYRVLCATI
ncbi:uncharacterized protein MONBRDRAFT_31641 [Monosiga brevicollis MX1]|uniref:ACB domain-containing protein n=1 Tax=Monosiga brevicollis TaxID=81824 RepID=A9UUV6_MONBE|nr:uncharacterized protein MONBRDRAFT_31641 [Monosiga brevicollis MX1]EDQ90784.1 predicted protein [Monosiga brevicollis MX1]|eukprot:XP_001744081.1 hypothetical protein [Monosiga brevicollis MX1]